MLNHILDLENILIHVFHICKIYSVVVENIVLLALLFFSVKKSCSIFLYQRIYFLIDGLID